jgi:signal transduction histidine kinase
MDQPEPQDASVAVILELSRLVCSSLDLDVVFERILTAVRDLSGADVISIMLLDASSQALRIVAAYGIPPEIVASYSFRLGEGIAGWAALHGKPVHTRRPGADARFVPVMAPPDATLLALPLRVRERTLGVINLTRIDGDELFSPATAQMVEIFASHAAIAIENAAAATAMRYAAARERIGGLVLRAPQLLGTAAHVAGRILDELAENLEGAPCMVYIPTGGSYRLLASSAAEGAAPGHWRPIRPAEAHGEHCTAEGCELQLRIATPERESGWLVVNMHRHCRYWHQEERDLIAFAADQIALLLANERLVGREQQSRALSQTLSQLAAACNALVGEGQLLDFILDQLARFIAYDSSGVFLFHHDDYARMVAGSGFREAAAGVVLYTGPGSLVSEVCRQRRAVYMPDVQRHAGWQEVPDSKHIHAWIGTPLLVNDMVIGLLTIDKWEPDSFSEGDVQVAQLFADHVTVAINNQRLLRDAQERAGQIELLHQISARLSAFREVDPLLNEVARLLHSSFGYYQVLVSLIEGEELVVHAAYGAVTAADTSFFQRRFSLEVGLTGLTARTGRTLLVNDVRANPHYFAPPELAETAAELVVAIKGDQLVLGVITLESTQTGAFSRHDLQLVEAVASQTAMALENIARHAELRRSEERLAQNERLRTLGELASGVAHDFNNLLAGILGHTQLLLGEPLAAHLTPDLRVIERAALDGAATVRRLQSFAQTSRARPSEAVDLNEVVGESLAITRPRWRDGPQSCGVTITIRREAATLPPIAGDGPALRDLVTNLVLNAIDALPEGGELCLRTALLDTTISPLAEPAALLEVTDNGVGMSPEVRELIFTPFFTTKGRNGTGMGLTMVQGIVQRHHGQIEVVSAPRQGTSVRVYLPARAAPVREQPLAQPAAAKTRYSILVVDDDEAVRQVLIRQLDKLGHHVVAARSGEEALIQLAAEPIAVLCTDLGMPGMSGWDLIARARGLAHGLRVILVTGWGEQIALEEAHARGVDAVIVKPFDARRLQQVIADLS